MRTPVGSQSIGRNAGMVHWSDSLPVKGMVHWSDSIPVKQTVPPLRSECRASRLGRRPRPGSSVS